MKEENNSHIQALGEGQIKYKGHWYTESFILFNEEIITSWPHPEVKDLKIDDFKFARKRRRSTHCYRARFDGIALPI
jgi:uncharacterized protein